MTGTRNRESLGDSALQDFGEDSSIWRDEEGVAAAVLATWPVCAGLRGPRFRSSSQGTYSLHNSLILLLNRLFPEAHHVQ